MAIIKILEGGTYSMLLIKLKFTHNKAILDIVNKGKDTMIFRPEEMIGIIHLTLSTPHMTIVTLSHLVQKVPSLELLRATEFSMRLV